jgi:uncharacterized protein (DUF433 family)
VGAYTIPEAALLLRAKEASVRRWVSGYRFKSGADAKSLPPLWRTELPKYDNHIEIGFRDLIELKFVVGFLHAGLRMQVIRRCLEEAAKILEEDRPFSTRKFKTDGRSIFLATVSEDGRSSLLNLRSKQFVFERIVQQTFKDLDFEHNVVASWRPYKGKQSIVIDPRRSFGQPIVKETGVPTRVLAEAMLAEGDAKVVARFYETTLQSVKDAVAFEKSLVVV